MNIHPEFEGSPFEELMKSMGNAETVEIRCQCGEDVVMNAAYAQYVKAPLESCTKCR